MTAIIRRARAGRGPRAGVALAGALMLAACADFDIRNTNAPTSDNLTETPSRAILSRTAVGIQTQAFTELQTEIEFYGIYGREGYNLLGNDPRETGEQIRGPQEPGGRSGGGWVGKYQAIRTINTFLGALDKVTDLTDEERTAATGFANTIKAWHLHRLAVRSGPTGIPIDVDRPIDAEPAPFVSFDDAMAAVSTLLDEARTDLLAGGTEFPFPLVPGYAGFTTPASFAEFNRALAAKVLVHRATFTGCTACWAQAETALDASFVTDAGLPGSLATGVYYGYTGAAGELSNPITEALTSNRYWVHPSIVTGAQLQAGGEPDLRLTAKTIAAAEPRTLNDLTATHKFILYNDPDTQGADPGHDLAWITNEELLLLRAEIRWNTGDRPGAIDDLNLIRQHAGGLAPTTLTAASPDADFVTELLYNRLYSLLWSHGARWIDARRYDRLSSLPIDRTGDQVHPYMLVPAAECDARGLQVPCTPLGAG